jgi:hypothetical protein
MIRSRALAWAAVALCAVAPLLAGPATAASAADVFGTGLPGISGIEGAGARITAMSCPAVSFCMAIGWMPGRTFAAWFDGAQWHDASGGLAPSLNLMSVSCPSEGWCMAVGDRFDEPLQLSTSVALEWQGASWIGTPGATLLDGPVVPGASYELTGVSCATAAVCLASGFASTGTGEAATSAPDGVLAWDGVSWQDFGFAFPSGTVVVLPSCTGAGACTMTIGRYTSAAPLGATVVERLVGTAWQPVATLGGLVTGYVCASASFCAATLDAPVSRGGASFSTSAFMTWDAGSWRQWADPGAAIPGAGFEPESLSCSGPRQCLVVEGPSTPGTVAPGVEVFDGSGWTFEPDETGLASGASCVPATTTCYLYGSGTVNGATPATSMMAMGRPIGARDPVVGITPTPDGRGYWLAAADGGVFAFGDASFGGSMAGARLASPVSSIAAAAGGGYWELGLDGGVFALGGAPYAGSLVTDFVPSPPEALIPTPSGRGYWLALADGGLATEGDAPALGDPAKVTRAPVVGGAAAPGGRGLWLATSDGGVYSLGTARFYGSMSAHPLGTSIVGMAATPGGRGYWLAGGDGAVFAFGNAPYLGSLSRIPLAATVVGIAATPDGKGYWLVSSDGGVFAYGDAHYHGSLPALGLQFSA